MSQRYSRDQLVARLVRAGELEVSGDSPEEAADYFAPDFTFHAPGGSDADFEGLGAYFASLRAAFEDRSIHRGIMVVEGNTIACQTWIEGTFVDTFKSVSDRSRCPERRSDHVRADQHLHPRRRRTIDP